MLHQTFILRNEDNAKRLYAFLKANWRAMAEQDKPLSVLVTEKNPRTLDQNAKFHAICDELGKRGVVWAGKPRNAGEWKVLLVSGHAVATKQGAEMVPGLEGEFVNIRESTARMSKARSSSLIDYTQAWCASNGVELSE